MLPAHEYAQYAQVVQMLQQLEIPGHRDLMHLEPVDDAESNFDPSDDSENDDVRTIWNGFDDAEAMGL